jgi:hypothetical protein
VTVEVLLGRSVPVLHEIYAKQIEAVRDPQRRARPKDRGSD